MKPVKNFRERLDGHTMWVDGRNYMMAIPKLGAEDLLWFNPVSVSISPNKVKYKLWINFDWENNRYFVNRTSVEKNGPSEQLLLASLQSDRFTNMATFLQEFMYPLIEQMSREDKWEITAR